MREVVRIGRPPIQQSREVGYSLLLWDGVEETIAHGASGTGGMILPVNPVRTVVDRILAEGDISRYAVQITILRDASRIVRDDSGDALVLEPMTSWLEDVPQWWPEAFRPARFIVWEQGDRPSLTGRHRRTVIDRALTRLGTMLAGDAQ